jgi:very-short-patch-repair endonuclease
MRESEWKLWGALRKRQVEGHRFRRQHPIGPYIVDFVCLEKRLVVEVDGGHHTDEQQMASDGRRTRWLEGEGFHVFRVWNTEVFDNLDGVVTSIWAELERLPSVRIRSTPTSARRMS